MTKSTLSVIVPNYNHASFVARALNSILQQSRPADEIVVIDDGSTDNSVEVIGQIARGHSTIRFVRNEANMGNLAAFARAMTLVQGDYVHIFAADDYVLPGLYEQSMQVLETHPEAEISSCDMGYYLDGTSEVRAHRLGFSAESRYFSTAEFLQIVLNRPINHMPICPPPAILKREAIERVGLVPQLRNYADWFLHIVTAFRTGFCYVPLVGAVQRLAKGTFSQSLQADLGSSLQVVESFLRLLDTPGYQDIRGCFMQTGSLSNYPAHTLRVAYASRPHWSYITPRLLHHVTALDFLHDPVLEPFRSELEQEMLRGIVLMNIGRASEAAAIARRVLERDATHVHARHLLESSGSGGANPPTPGAATLAGVPAVRTPTELLEEIERLRTQYGRRGGTPEIERRFRDARFALASEWMRLRPAEVQAIYEGPLGKANQAILDSGIVEAVLDEREAQLLQTVRNNLALEFGGTATVNNLLAGMLFAGPHQLLTGIDLAKIPQWFLNDFFTFTLRTPQMFRALGEVDAFRGYLQNWLAFLHARIAAEPASDFWRKVAALVLQRLNVIPLYFSEGNQREIYRLRAAIIEQALANLGHRLDYEFPPRDPARRKWRYGVLNAHFQPQTETYATIPAFKHLDRERYEVVLIASRETGHALESYCRQHADRFVALPQDPAEAVRTIRELDLDALWIGSNVTAVTNPIVILAAHRLARLQMTSACLPATTGFRNIDVFVSGSLSEPEQGAQEHYTEQLELVNGISHCFDMPVEQEPPATLQFTRGSLGAGPRDTIFVSGANFYKIIPELEAAWMRVLAEVPEAILVLYPFNPNWSSSYPAAPFVERLSAGARACGVSPDRIKILMPMPGRSDIKNLLRACDVYLDSFPHSGITSMLDPLEVGLPTVVRDGAVMRARMGAAMMRTMRIEELIAPDVEGFVRLCARLAGDVNLRRRLSERIAAAMAAKPAFFDPEWYGKEVERILDRLLPERAAR